MGLQFANYGERHKEGIEPKRMGELDGTSEA